MASRQTHGVGLPRRRNGKEQACEPCRKAKIACDHGLPVCDRCKRRKVTAKCMYLVAPMTRPVGVGAGAGAGAGARKQSEPRAANLIPTSFSSKTSSPVLNTNITTSAPAPTSSSQPAATLPPTPNTGASASPLTPFHTQLSSTAATTNTKPTPESCSFVKPGGFFGPTNFSAVFSENRENLGNDDLQISNGSDPFIPSFQSLHSQTFLMLSGRDQGGSPRLALGVKILRAMPDQQTSNFLLEWYFEKCSDCTSYKLSIMAIANSFWGTFGKQMKEPRRADDMEQLSALMCKNAENPLEEFHEFERWIASFTGTNMRWEALGSVFGALTQAVLSLPERDAFFCTQRGDRNDRKSFAVEMKDCVQACITSSNYMDLLNVLMIALLARNLILQTVITGDTSLVVWRCLGDLVSSTTALGLHRQMDDDGPITFLSEMKKYLFTVVFRMDKGASTLTGRPPALSYQYTRFKVPLDLDDEVTIRGGEELSRAIATLDAKEWNTEGKINSNTKIRAAGFLSILQNQILELSLGNPEDCTSEKTKLIMSRLDETYETFPPFIQFYRNDPSLSECSDGDFWSRLNLRTTYLEHKLILERLAHKQGISDGQSMIDCAREMLELIVLLWVQRDRFVEYHHDYDWMLMCRGVPSSGVLCVELLKEMKSPSGPNNLPRLPRSEIVQNLSLLVGFLEWVKPAAGNYQLCRRMRLIIKRILDQILNPSPASSAPAPSQESVVSDGQSMITGSSGPDQNGVMTGFEQNGFDAGGFGDGLDNLDWLNTVDWSRGPWIDLGGQDLPPPRWG